MLRLRQEQPACSQVQDSPAAAIKCIFLHKLTWWGVSFWWAQKVSPHLWWSNHRRWAEPQHVCPHPKKPLNIQKKFTGLLHSSVPERYQHSQNFCLSSTLVFIKKASQKCLVKSLIKIDFCQSGRKNKIGRQGNKQDEICSWTLCSDFLLSAYALFMHNQ